MKPGEVCFWGSVTNGDIIVACSGVQPWYDEAFAAMILALCEALIQQEVEDYRKAGEDFLPQ